MAAIEIIRTPPGDVRKILRICLAAPHQTPAELERQVTAFLEYTRAMMLDPNRQWICRSGGKMLSACTCIESPGRTAMLLLPEGGSTPRTSTAMRRLIDHVVKEESNRRIRLVQALIAVDDPSARAALHQTGFRDVAVLEYMTLKLTKDYVPPAAPTPPCFRSNATSWIPYDSKSHSLCADLIQATYKDGLDCPDLRGLRDIEDVIESHKAAGRFDPKRWLILAAAGKPNACVLFVENPLRPALELVYMGVHPDHRRQTIGQYILNHGLRLARRDRFQAVTLAVDSRNIPARVLYDRAGFRVTATRRALVRPIGVNLAEP